MTASAALSLAGRRVLVTGSGQRLGRAVAEGIVDAGADVILMAHESLEGAELVAKRATSAGRLAAVIAADLSDRKDSDAAFERVLIAAQEMGGFDAVVHAAASFEKADFSQTSESIWDRVLELNLTAPFRIARAFQPALSNSNAPGGGSIVLFSELSAFLPFPDHFAHTVAKGSIVSLTRALARSLAPRIRVNAVAPGPVLPPETFSDEERTRAFERIPMIDAGGPDEVVRAVIYLLTAERVTGEVIRIDGGRGLR